MGVASGNRGTWNNRGTAGPRGAGDGGLRADGLQQGSRGPDRKRRVLARGRGVAAAAVPGVLPAAGRHILCWGWLCLLLPSPHSGVFHTNVKQRWLQGDRAVIDGMNKYPHISSPAPSLHDRGAARPLPEGAGGPKGGRDEGVHQHQL